MVSAIVIMMSLLITQTAAIEIQPAWPYLIILNQELSTIDSFKSAVLTKPFDTGTGWMDEPIKGMDCSLNQCSITSLVNKITINVQASNNNYVTSLRDPMNLQIKNDKVSYHIWSSGAYTKILIKPFVRFKTKGTYKIIDVENLNCDTDVGENSEENDCMIVNRKNSNSRLMIKTMTPVIIELL